MVDSDSVIGRPTVLRAWREETNAVVAVIPVTGDESGAFAIYMQNATADAIAPDLVDTSEGPLDGAVREATVRELARMVVTIARRDKRLSRVTLGSPVVRSTGPIGDMPQKLRPWVTVPVGTTAGQVMVGLSLNARKTSEELSPAQVRQAVSTLG